MEKTSPAPDLAALSQAALSTPAIVSWAEVVSRPETTIPISAAMREQLASRLESMARVLTNGAYPIDIELDQLDGATLPAASSGLWEQMRSLLAQFAQPGPQPPAPASQPKAQPQRGGGFFLPDAWTNPEYVRYAVKTTAAAMFCYVLYSLLDWPGIHTCFITCYIVSLGTTAETIEKLLLRILGCLVGAAAGLFAIVYVMPSTTSIEGLLAVVFVGALGAAWVAAGSQRISYAGFQIAFAFFLCVIQGPSPAFDLTTARDRVIGILLGNVAVFLLFTRLWPVSVARGIDSGIAGVLRSLSALTTTVDLAGRLRLSAQAQNALGSVEQTIKLAQYEPRSIRPDESWLRARHRALEEIGALQGPLLLSPARGQESPSSTGGRLERIANGLAASPAPASSGADSVISPAPAGSAPVPAIRSPLAEMIDRHLAHLEEALTAKPPAAGESASARTISDAT